MRRPLFTALILAAAFLGWLFRYEYVPGPLGVPLRMNRWTGQVEKLDADADRAQPLDWYQVPMRADSRRLQEAARQARIEQAREQQERMALEAAQAEREARYREQVPYGSDGQGYGGSPPGVAAPVPWHSPRYLPLPPAMVPRAVPRLEGPPEPVRTWPRHLWSPMN